MPTELAHRQAIEAIRLLCHEPGFYRWWLAMPEKERERIIHVLEWGMDEVEGLGVKPKP